VKNQNGIPYPPPNATGVITAKSISPSTEDINAASILHKRKTHSKATGGNTLLNGQNTGNGTVVKTEMSRRESAESSDENDGVVSNDVEQPAGILLHPSKQAKGKSCHQCKTRRIPMEMYACGNLQRKVSKRICRKRFCKSCLLKSYTDLPADINSGTLPVFSTTWSCPSCKGTCICASCRRQAAPQFVDHNSTNNKGAAQVQLNGGPLTIGIHSDAALSSNTPSIRTSSPMPSKPASASSSSLQYHINNTQTEAEVEADAQIIENTSPTAGSRTQSEATTPEQATRSLSTHSDNPAPVPAAQTV